MYVGFSLCMNDSIQLSLECAIDCGSGYPWSRSCLSDIPRADLSGYVCMFYYPLITMNTIFLLKSLTLIHSDSPNLIKFLTPPPSLRKYKWHPGLLSGKCHGGILCACRFIRGPWITCHSPWRLQASSLSLRGDAGRCQKAFLAPLPRKS